MCLKGVCSMVLFLLLPTSSILLSSHQSQNKLNVSLIVNGKYEANVKESKNGKMTSSTTLLPQASSSVISTLSLYNRKGSSEEKTSSISATYLSSLSIYYDDPPTLSSMSKRQKRSSSFHSYGSKTGAEVDSLADPLSAKNTSPRLESKQSDSTTTAAPTESFPTCRFRYDLPVNLYNLDTCASCYHYMRNGPSFFGNPSTKLNSSYYKYPDPETKKVYILMGLYANGVRVLANASDPDKRITESFVNKDAQAKWVDCCKAAERCCETMQQSIVYQNETTVAEKEESFCPPTWDGWQCWGAFPAGAKAEALCPPYIYSIMEPPSCTLKAVKVCTQNGTWYRRNSGSEWTDYRECGNAGVTLQRNRAYVHVAAYYISIIAITPALAIFFSYKQLRVHRIILHQNLFLSMFLNGILVVVFKTTVILNELKSDGTHTTIISENGIPCRLLFILTKYSRMTNYMWMFCEGFYLHKLIAAAFAEQKSLLVFYLIGWVFPIFPTAVYAGFRIFEADEKCWVVPQEMWEWALNGPSLLSLLINVVFLINIIRVLVTKLRAAHAQEPSQYRKAVRATLVLLPLFGVHFIVTIYRPPSSTGACLWTEFYFYTNDILDGLQGFLVALIFCYCNGEVSSLLKRTYTNWREQRANGAMYNRRKSSAANLRARNSRAGSMLGRSVVSTHVYSSVPPSPEPNSTSTQNVMVSLGGQTLSTSPRTALSESISSSSLKKPNCNNSSPNAVTLNGKSSTMAVSVNLYVTTSDAKSGNIISETRLVHPGDSLELKELEGTTQSPKSSTVKNGLGNGNEHQL